MRLTKRFLARSFALVVVLIFALPLLLYYLDSRGGEGKGARLERPKHGAVMRQDKGGGVRPPPGDWKAVGTGALGGRGFHPGAVKPPAGERRDEGAGANEIAPQLNEPQGPPAQADPQGPDLGPMSFGPKAEFIAGVLGNYEPPQVSRSGAGEGGEAVFTTMEEKERADRSIQEFGFNMVASDKIAMNRTIPDSRMAECKYWRYPQVLPTASVIVVFHNEGFSTLMRTVHSIIDQSPPALLAEVVMVDDFSDKPLLKQHLDDYIRQFHGKVKLYRNAERLGLIGTRSMGARYATGDVIVFLDAHCECGPNWLPPLLARIAYDRTIMTVPIIDGIDWNTFRYSPVYGKGEHFRGIFEWGFLYKESRVPDSVLARRAHDSEPYPAPTHAGGLFAIDRHYFEQLGAYDPGLQIWGGENFELSFKIWQCGGSIEWVPCSRVGHVYRNHMPYGFGAVSSKVPIILLNYMRVVEVWLDEPHREYFYTREPTIRGYPIGDISAQVQFKQKHRCHSFQWFLDNVAIEVAEKFPPPPPNVAWGEIKLQGGQNICWDTKGEQPNGGAIGAYSCHHLGGNQLFRLNAEGQLATGERCIEPWGAGARVVYCPVTPGGRWVWEGGQGGRLKDRDTNKCVTVVLSDPHQGDLKLLPCTDVDPLQQFSINPIRTW